MPTPEAIEEEAARWLRYAMDDFAAARALHATPGMAARIVGFHAQQAAEKALKALLVLAQTPFPYTHDLARLHGLVGPEHRVTARVDWQRLTDFAVDARYPDDLPDVAPDEVEEALDDADRVVRKALAALRGSG